MRLPAGVRRVKLSAAIGRTTMRPVILSAIAAMGGLAVASAGSANAQLAYEWSPQNTTTHLTGNLVFVPTDGNGALFQCKVAFDFYTGNIKKGADKLPKIISAKVKGKGCESVQILDLPWYVGAIDTQDGSLSYEYWNVGAEGCRDDNGSGFYVLTDGRWSMGVDGSCFQGYLTSNPPVTIVPVP